MGTWLMKSSQSNFDLQSPSSFLVRSYLITTVSKIGQNWTRGVAHQKSDIPLFWCFHKKIKYAFIIFFWKYLFNNELPQCTVNWKLLYTEFRIQKISDPVVVPNLRLLSWLGLIMSNTKKDLSPYRYASDCYDLATSTWSKRKKICLTYVHK